MIKISFEKRKKKKTSFVEFSKKALTAMIIIWFLGAVYGFFVASVQLYRHEFVSLAELFAYIGAPMTGGIVSYMIKTAIENVPKIKRDNADTNLDDVSDTDGSDLP